MAKIVFLACSKTKATTKQQALNLYTSALFQLSLLYAKKLAPDTIYVLSAKHGLVDLYEELEPYEQTLIGADQRTLKLWTAKVQKQLAEKNIVLKETDAVFLAGKQYRKYLASLFKTSTAPLSTLGLGKQLQFLKNATQ